MTQEQLDELSSNKELIEGFILTAQRVLDKQRDKILTTPATDREALVLSKAEYQGGQAIVKDLLNRIKQISRQQE